MRASDLSDYLGNQTTISNFLEAVDDDVRSYIKQISKTGSAILLTFDEDEKLVINISNLKKLLKDTQETKLQPAHLSYICDCLTMAKNVEYETEKVENLIWEFADPEINGYKTPEELKLILDAL